MNLFDLNAVPIKRKRKKRVGRGIGSGWGKTAGRGAKGASSRSGFSMKKLFEGGQTPLFRRLPKRGFNNIFKKEYNIVNLKDIAHFGSGDIVTIAILKESGIIKKIGVGVKVLGEGELKNSITVEAHKFSKVAMKKIKAAGGEAKIIP
ncbi:MAG: 50S ribosomal protein L15 [Planctomycetia bacterium]|uniref:50S ribosomal protein L15 n=1 Tax=Candidatus Kuenenia sp. TaxID=2499824 RepID=UPI001DC928A9|nr:50S ribosomal protein L15 [Planctomycetia bacterium]